MKSIICSIFVSVLFAIGIVSAQPVAGVDSSTTALDAKMEVYVKENIPFKLNIPYPSIREADVVYEKTVWRVVELREKQNLPLYFPIAPTRKIGSRVNFFHLLMEGVERGEITAYDAIPVSDEFASTQIRTYEQIISNPLLKEENKQVASTSVYTGRDTMITQFGKNVMEDEEVVRLIIKEKHFFDKRHSRLDRQVIGICPWYVFPMQVEGGEPQIRKIPVMWIYYPEVRPLLARHPVFNDFNDAQNVSYDDFFMQHRYKGYIQKMSNVYNNRFIGEYMKGIDALFEAARLEDEIFNWEQDLWEY